MTRVLAIVALALAVAACGIKQDKATLLAAHQKDPPRMNVVYRYFSGTGEIRGMCKPGEKIVTVFCDNPSRYGEVIAPSAEESRPVGVCAPAREGRYRMTLSCGTP